MVKHVKRGGGWGRGRYSEGFFSESSEESFAVGATSTENSISNDVRQKNSRGDEREMMRLGMK